MTRESIRPTEAAKLVKDYLKATQALVDHLDHINYYGSSARDLTKLDKLRKAWSELRNALWERL